MWLWIYFKVQPNNFCYGPQPNARTHNICSNPAYGSTPYCHTRLLLSQIASEYPKEVTEIRNERILKASTKQCSYQYQRGRYLGDICPNAVYGSTPYCDFCLLRKPITLQYPKEVAEIWNKRMLKAQSEALADNICPHCNGTGIINAILTF